MKRKTVSEETGKAKMDAPANIDGSEHPANPLPNPPETFPPEMRPLHEGFMREALAMAQLALDTDETPVGCVFVHNGVVVARGMNATNRTLNGTRHAEFIAIASLLSPTPLPASTSPNDLPQSDPSRPAYTADVLTECDLYVTVEPCVMCASLLRQFGIRKVYFGAANDRFGGTGGVLNIHDCAAVDPAYEVSGGWLREEAIMMLRRFYVQENEKAPAPRPKKERVLNLEVEPLVKTTGDNPS
ncbi:hypothetical protein V492_05878 [Pseudogymnoascus sp. VKM F-4246]|nr:hypothetical protein V492_05878 [Pseudogymnoascus sp. VKM F-4246]